MNVRKKWQVKKENGIAKESNNKVTDKWHKTKLIPYITLLSKF